MGGATQFSTKQDMSEHEYDQLIQVVKKGSNKDEGVDAETGHDYHVLEGSRDDNDYDYSNKQEEEMVYHVLEGPTLTEEETQFT